MTQIRWTQQAVGDLEAIREFVERDSPRYGRLVAEQLFDAVQRIAAFPRSGRSVPELDRDDVREVVRGDYRIVYQLSDDTVRVLTIFRSSRLFPTSLRSR
ncbi:MAG: type II toxin-antitoxin system RelE/ParE family toxin [Longimicrobiales bacterium]